MRPSDFADTLVALAEHKPNAFAQAADGLLKWLHAGDNMSFLELSLELVRRPPVASAMFNNLMDLFVTEPVQLAGEESQGWRVYATVVLVEKPAGANLQKMSNPEHVEEKLAQLIGERREKVHVVARFLPTELAHSLSAVAAFQFCQRLKAMTESAMLPQHSEAEDNQQAAKMNVVESDDIDDSDDDAPNVWESRDARPHYAEYLMLILVRGGEQQSDEQSRRLNALDNGDFRFEAQFKMEDDDEPLTLPAQIVGFGGCWSAFRGALHTGAAYTLSMLIRRIARDNNRSLDELSVSFARVENGDDGEASVRVAVHVGLSNLLAGAIQQNLVEPDQYVAAARPLLASLGVADVTYCTDAFLANKVDDSEHVRVYVNGVGWLCAPETYVSH